MGWNALNFCIDNSIEYWTSGKNVQDGWVNIRCPFCDDHSNHGGFNPAKGYFHCWRCGGHKLPDTIMKLLSCNLEQAKSLFWDYSGQIEARRSLNKKVAKANKIDLPGGELLKIHKQYLIKRNFDPDRIVKKYKVLGTRTAGKYKYRLIIPIIYNGRVISFQARDVTDKQELRYKGLSVAESVVNYGHIFYGLDDTDHKEMVCVVEGVFDQWRMGDGFVASFGSSLTDQQIRILSTYKKVFFLFDDEEEAQKKAKLAAYKLSALGCSVEIIELDNGLDPAELSNDDARSIRMELGFGY